LKIIVGLGNPGARYALTRHNLGFIVVDALGDELGVKVSRRSCQALTATATLGGERLLLVKPQTFMNRSGESVAELLDYMKADPSDLIVAHDDLDLSFGSIRIRKSGGDGGHNGVASIVASLGTGSFVRVKMGIGRPQGFQPPADYVLSGFEPEEEDAAMEMAAQAVKAVLFIVREGAEKAMNLFNKRQAEPDLP
jgi:PTH1 family peptidyl-tRNA hydrolase